MKKIRNLTIILTLISILILVNLIFVMQYNNSITIYSRNLAEVLDTSTSLQKEKVDNDINSISVIPSIEKELKEEGTTILEVLYNQRNFYLNELNTIGNDQRNSILSKISILNEAIVSFEQRSSINYDDSDLQTTMDNPSVINQFGISPNCTCTEVDIVLGNPCANCVEYKQTYDEVVAISAGFTARGWKLAADLILHNIDNKEYDSDYWPILGNTIAEAPQMIKIAGNTLLTEASIQNSPGYLHGLFESTIEGDMYNSLGSFYYSKFDAGNGNVFIDIIDRYDWDYSTDGGSASVFNDTLALAQEIGVVTPFYTRINLTMSGYVPYNWRYCDDGIEILGVADDIEIAEIPKDIVDLSIKPKDNVDQPHANITKIGDNAFKGNEKIKKVVFSDRVNTIGNSAFNGCTKLESVSNLTNVEYIGRAAFENCKNLNALTSLSSIKHIGDYAFKNCVQLTNLSNLSNLDFIGAEAFYNCTNMTNLLLPIKLNYIGERAFGKCNNLNFNIDNANKYYYTQNNILYNKDKTDILGTGKIESSITILDSVVRISSYAFAENSNLKNVHINNSIILGTSSFASCENLQQVYFYSIYLPQIGDNAFSNDSFTIYVPYNSQSNYRTAFASYTDKIDSIQVQVEFNNKGKIVETKNVYFGSTIDNCILPTSEGEVFEGWYDSNGVKYIDKEGNGVKLIDKTEKIILHSNWSIKSYKIKINANGYVTWLGPNGLSNSECDIAYGTTLSAINLIAEFKATKQGYKEGEIFDHFKYQNEVIYWTTVPDLGEDGVTIEITPVWKKEVHTIYFETFTDKPITKIENEHGKSITIPQPEKRTGYHFAGWYTNPAYTGEKVQWVSMPDLTPKKDNISYSEAQNNGSIELYAKWTEILYMIQYDANGGSGSMETSMHYYTVEKALNKNQFSRTGHYFTGWSLEKNNVVEFGDQAKVKSLTEQMTIKLYACWQKLSVTSSWQYIEGEPTAPKAVLQSRKSLSILYGESAMLGANDVEGYTFKEWSVLCKTSQGNASVRQYSTLGTITISYNYVESLKKDYSSVDFYAVYTKNCVAEGTMITLADGSQVPVETLTGNEQLLTWNMLTGNFESAPILFMDKDSKMNCEVINLTFSDGTIVKVISEHAFWDIDLNKYVFLRRDAAKYIGHWFNKQTTDLKGNMIWKKVQLVNVNLTMELTATYSPVTYGHLCYYVNGMLSMPGATEGLINIFDVDPETMMYDQEKMQADIETYGLFTYEEFAEIVPVTEDVFNAFNGQYLKVSIGKGLISIEQLIDLFNRYADFLA